MSDNNTKSKLGRREAIQMLGMGITAVGFLAREAIAAEPKAAPKAAPAAAPAPAAAAGPESCKAAAPIDDASKSLRRALQYKEKSDQADKKCSGCAQFEGKKYGDCGACKLFTGAVNPNGVCLSYAPIAAK